MASEHPALGEADRRPVVVTGGAGYIGALVVRKLLRRNQNVRVLDSLVYGDAAIRDLRRHPRLDVVVDDLRDPIAVHRALEDASAVIHLGAIVGDPACAIAEDEALSTNVAGTEIVTEAARAHGIARLVFASTCSVYGASLEPLDEDSILHPVSLYANTKIAAEQILLEHRSATFDPVILRFGTAFGLAPRVRFDLVVNLLAAKAVQDGQITIHGGAQWRPFIHVDDIASAVVLALDAPRERVSGQIINVGVDALNYQLSTVGEIINRLVPLATVVTSDKVTDKRNYYVSFAKAQRLLGFSATRTVEDGVLELVDLLASDALGSYQDPVYHNVIALSAAFAQRSRLAEVAKKHRRHLPTATPAD